MNNEYVLHFDEGVPLTEIQRSEQLGKTVILNTPKDPTLIEIVRRKKEQLLNKYDSNELVPGEASPLIIRSHKDFTKHLNNINKTLAEREAARQTASSDVSLSEKKERLKNYQNFSQEQEKAKTEKSINNYNEYLQRRGVKYIFAKWQ